MSAAVAPVAEAEQFESLDLLRGFAVLGILSMNIQLFAMPFVAYGNPESLGQHPDLARVRRAPAPPAPGRRRARSARASVAAGRLAFTCYIAETVICTTIFYGHGLGLFGRVDRAGQLAVVAGVWIVLLAVAPWWLARFRYGPLEWLWRATYAHVESIRRRTLAPASGG